MIFISNNKSSSTVEINNSSQGGRFSSSFQLFLHSVASLLPSPPTLLRVKSEANKKNEFNKILIKLQKGVSKEFFAPLLHAASQLAATKKIIKENLKRKKISVRDLFIIIIKNGCRNVEVSSIIQIYTKLLNNFLHL